jgi:uncharacterized repeat protein (TIGR02543 family)
VLTVDVSSAQGGNVEIDGMAQTTYPSSQNIDREKIVVLEAVPAYGYDFVGWSGSLTGTENPVSINMTCPKNVTATFAGKDEFVLTIKVSGGGTVTPATGLHSYFEGNIVTLSAQPNSHYRFEGWTGDVSNVTSANTTVTMDAAKTVTANFSPINHTLTIDITGQGTVSPSVGSHTCLEGSNIMVIATPAKGYEFKGWTGAVIDITSANTTVTVDYDMTVTANFSKVPLNWPLIGGISGGVVIAGAIAGGFVWFTVKRRGGNLRT